MSNATIKFAIQPDHLEELVDRVLTELGEEELQHSIMACSVVIARLVTASPLTSAEEVDFIQSLLDWAGGYLAATEGIPN